MYTYDERQTIDFVSLCVCVRVCVCVLMCDMYVRKRESNGKIYVRIYNTYIGECSDVKQL